MDAPATALLGALLCAAAACSSRDGAPITGDPITGDPPAAAAPPAAPGATAGPEADPAATRTGFQVPDARARVAALGNLAGLPSALRAALGPSEAFTPIAAPDPGDWLAQHVEAGQTFDQFVAARFNRPHGERRKIYLLPIGRFERPASPALATLAEFTRRYFDLPVEVLPPVTVAEVGARERRDQLLTSDILRYLMRSLPADAYCLIALTEADLYPGDGWNFVFGMATFRDRVGVYSFARYHPEFYGEAAAEGSAELVLRRALKVMAHEIGHMFGLDHCVYYECVLAGTNHLGETDSRPLHLCPVCLRKLVHSVGFDPLARYRDLGRLYRRLGLGPEADWIEDRLAAIASD